MVFSSTLFLFLFLPIVMIIYFGILRKRSTKNRFLFLASLIFYAWGEPVFVFLLMVSILITYALGRLIDRLDEAAAAEGKVHRRFWLVLGTAYHILVMFVFKYITFAASQLGLLLGRDFSFINISLPIGISFFTFQMMSYLFDVYYGNSKCQKNILNLGLYVCLFPQLIAGPIVRYQTIADEIDDRRETLADFEYGISRFVLGLGKKVLLADFLAKLADEIFASEGIGQLGLVSAWIGSIAYSLEIYFDFSGYSDMAIGLGRCFGFHFLENFRHPYTADSINDFWKKWHISLTDWFRDYVYIPLGGNRVSKSRHILNFCIVWLLTGIWHGANWTFILWGAVYCLLQILERFVYQTAKWPRAVRRIYTLLLVNFCWVIFRADSVADAVSFIAAMLGKNGLTDSLSAYYVKSSALILLIGAACSLPLLDRLKETGGYKNHEEAFETIKYAALILVVIAAAVTSISGGYSPFIYFNF